MKKILISIFILIIAIAFSGCSKKEEVKDVINEEETYYRIGKLTYYVPDTFTYNKTSTDNLRVYIINNEDTNISIWFSYTKDVDLSIEDYMKQDIWEPVFDSLEKKKYNGYEWYVQTSGEFKLYTKYENDVYAIRINSLDDRTNLLYELCFLIPSSLRFN